ncbi:MAG TPA: hypothetical protein VHE59_02250 [Mucilaginibacter sp.]|nr:hypothetical protein [Mucilaginibacter sp.]
MKQDTSAKEGLFKTHRSYTPEEIFAAGGATAFGRKRQKDNASLIKALEDAQPIEPFTDEEWNDLMEQLKRDK